MFDAQQWSGGVWAKRCDVAMSSGRREALADHRVSLHLSLATPTRCSASGQGFLRRRGDVDLTPALAPGGFEALRGSASLEVGLPLAFLRGVASELGLAPARAELAPRHMVRDGRLTHLLLALDAELQQGQPGCGLYAEGIALALAAQLLRQPPDEAEGDAPPARLRRVLDYVEDHLEQRLTLQRLADVAGTGRTQLQRDFKAHVGRAVHRYVLERRVDKARALLAAGMLPAAEVALAAGFAHQSHMARWMRELLGDAPRRWRG
ncbi:MAG: helix-turn-helix transcriptional regulator [Burkholderiales bacterium]|nr:helix-turn-helix transcriptional regulator [Burkholderiales bacterium]